MAQVVGRPHVGVRLDARPIIVELFKDRGIELRILDQHVVQHSCQLLDLDRGRSVLNFFFHDSGIRVFWVMVPVCWDIGFPVPGLVGSAGCFPCFPRSRFFIWNLRNLIEATPVVGELIGVAPCINWLAIPICGVSQDSIEEELRTAVALDPVSTLLHDLQLMFGSAVSPGHSQKRLGVNCFHVHVRHRDESFLCVPASA